MNKIVLLIIVICVVSSATVLAVTAIITIESFVGRSVPFSVVVGTGLIATSIAVWLVWGLVSLLRRILRHH